MSLVGKEGKKGNVRRLRATVQPRRAMIRTEKTQADLWKKKSGRRGAEECAAALDLERAESRKELVLSRRRLRVVG